MIKIFNVNKIIKSRKLKGPVTSPQIYLGKSQTFHPQGLYSEEIFGMDGSKERKQNLSWVDLNSTVIHPSLYDIISKTIERKIVKLIAGDTSFKISEDGTLEEDENGKLSGFTSLVKNMDKIKFRLSKDGTGNRNELVKMINNNIKKGTFFIDKLIIISPEYRPLGLDGSEEDADVLTELYQKIIRHSSQLKGVSGELYNILAYRMQMLIRELYELSRVTISKKQGMIRKMILGKRVDFSARGVISPDPSLDLGQIGIPLDMASSLFENQLIYGLVNSKYAKNIPEEFHTAVKDFLGKRLELIDEV